MNEKNNTFTSYVNNFSAQFIEKKNYMNFIERKMMRIRLITKHERAVTKKKIKITLKLSFFFVFKKCN